MNRTMAVLTAATLALCSTVTARHSHAGQNTVTPAIAIPKTNKPSDESGPTPFPDANLDLWTEQELTGHTRYDLVSVQGVPVLRGSTSGKASLLYHEQQIDLEKSPWLDWSWKVDHIISGFDEKSRAGDDFPARLYIIVRTGFLPWETLALNYVWSSSTPVGSLWFSPFTDKSAMIAVQSGNEKVGLWTHQRRNVKDDFKTAFGMDIKAIDGFAVMVDGDNTSSSATAWFGDIRFTAP
ncbi:MAG: DUF3047 domain-containing protein [Granulosicoccus sp.]